VLGSKHLGFTFRVQSEIQVKEIIQSFRKKHHSATQVCFAWKLKGDKGQYRYSDDGEPSGTAGRPIYNQILHFELADVLAIVVRYFGGTKLGTGGLMDAYKTAARLAIENSTIEELPITESVTLHFPYSVMPQIMTILKQHEAVKGDITQAEEVKMRVEIASAFLASFKTAIAGIPECSGSFSISSPDPDH
jgi:uncharacterized YigZ family protein